MNIDARLREQNALAGWVDCEARGGAHRWRLSGGQCVGKDPVAVYIPCARCPVSLRTTIRDLASGEAPYA